jgi:hypothetical protein
LGVPVGGFFATHSCYAVRHCRDSINPLKGLDGTQKQFDLSAQLRVHVDRNTARPGLSAKFCCAQDFLEPSRNVNCTVSVDSNLTFGAFKIGRLH